MNWNIVETFPYSLVSNHVCYCNRYCYTRCKYRCPQLSIMTLKSKELDTLTWTKTNALNNQTREPFTCKTWAWITRLQRNTNLAISFVSPVGAIALRILWAPVLFWWTSTSATIYVQDDTILLYSLVEVSLLSFSHSYSHVRRPEHF